MTCPACGKSGVHTCSPQYKEVKMSEPKIITDIVKEAVFGLYENDYLCYHVASAGPSNVEFTFDGKTRELKSAKAVGFYARQEEAALLRSQAQEIERLRSALKDLHDDSLGFADKENWAMVAARAVLENKHD
jgi:hypothetical protein